jgi:hypothetical protein
VFFILRERYLQQSHIPEEGEGDHRHEREEERECDFLVRGPLGTLGALRALGISAVNLTGRHLGLHRFVLLISSSKRRKNGFPERGTRFHFYTHSIHHFQA